MEITKELRKRFCKDCSIPIDLYEEPYFTQRLKAFDPLYQSMAKWDVFINGLKKYNSEQEYLAEYNSVKDNVIDFIKNREAYQQFNDEDMNQFRATNHDFSSHDIFKESNVGKEFISIDMKKANFTALKYYNNDIFGKAGTWEEFISGFTSNQHIIESKYIRQVIMGNCNPKRQVTYEKYLMDRILTALLRKIPEKYIVFFSNDEIIIDIAECCEYEKADISFNVSSVLESFSVNEIVLTIERFILEKISGTSGYLKRMHSGEIEIKCLDSMYSLFVARILNEEKVTEDDKVFMHEGMLAKLFNIPDIFIKGTTV